MKNNRLHLIKRQNISPTLGLGVRTIATLASFIFIILVFMLFGKFGFGKVVSSMFGGAFATKTNVTQTLLNMCTLLILALGLAPAYRMKYWNTGALGQALIGNLCSSIVVFYLGDSIKNNFFLLLLALITAIIGGAIWGLIPGIFKAKLKANETLFTLMMNYIAIQLVKVFTEIMKEGKQNLEAFTNGHFDTIGSLKDGWVYIIVIVLVIFVYVYLKYTKHGYEIAVLGESFNTAKYAGVNTTKVIIRTAALSGALCAIAGFIFTGTSNILSTTSDGGYGFTSIIVTWTSHFSVLAMIVISFIIAFLKKGSDGVKDQSSEAMNEYASYIAIGIFLFFLIGCEFFLYYKLTKNNKEKDAPKNKVITKLDTIYQTTLVKYESFLGSKIEKAGNFIFTPYYIIKEKIRTYKKKKKRGEK